MAVKFSSNSNSKNNEESLHRRIAIVVDWFYALKKLLDSSSRPCISHCRCDQVKDLAIKIRCIGGILMDWSVEGVVSEADICTVDQHLQKFATSLKTVIAVKIGCDDPSTASLLLARTEKPISVVFEAVESIVKFVKELLCVPACAFDRCGVKLSLGKQRGKVVYHTNPAKLAKLPPSTPKSAAPEQEKKISLIGSTANANETTTEENEVLDNNDDADEMSSLTNSSKTIKFRKRRKSAEERNKAVKESVQKIIELLEKKRKCVRPDGLHQFVMWREAYKGAKVFLKRRKSSRRLSSLGSLSSLSSRIGNLTRLTCGRIGTTFYTTFL